MTRSKGTTIAAPNIVFTADTSAMTQEIRQTNAEVRQSAKAFEQGFAKGAAKAQRAMTKTSSAAKSIGKDFKGAGTAISGASASLQLMGQQGPPAIQTLAASVSSLVESGFGPIGIAIAAATAAITFFIKAVRDYSKYVDESNKKTERLVVNLVDLRQTRDAVKAGRSLADQKDLESLRMQERMLEGVTNRLNAARRDLEIAEETIASKVTRGRGVFDLAIFDIRNRDAAKDAIKELEAEQVILRNNVLNLREKSKLREEVAAAQKAAVEKVQQEAEGLERAKQAAAGLRTSTEKRLTALDSIAHRMREFRSSSAGPSDGVTGGPGAVTRDAMLNDPVFRVAAARQQASEEAAAARLEAAARQKELMEDLLEVERQVEREFPGGARLKPKIEAAKKGISEMAVLSRNLGETFARSFGGAIADAVTGARDLSDALRDVGRLILNTAIQGVVSGGVSKGLAAVGFASGGSFTVGGFGSTDSQLVAFKATPGERVSVQRPGQGGVSVVINNHTPSRVAAQDGVGPDGRRRLEIAVVDAVSRDMRRGGKTARATEQNYGVRRRGRRA